jgi:hypothetical protein
MKRFSHCLVYLALAFAAASLQADQVTPESFGLRPVERDPNAKLMDASLLEKVPKGGLVVLSTRTVDSVLFSLKKVEPEPKIARFVKATAKPDSSRRFSQPKLELSVNEVEAETPEIGRVAVAFARPLRIGSTSRITFRTKPDAPGGMTAYFEDLQVGTYYLECRFENVYGCIGRLKLVWADGPVKLYGYTEGKLTDRNEDRLVEMPMLLVVEKPMKEWAFDVQLDTDIGSVEFERLFMVKLL